MRGDNHLNICRYGSPLDGIRSIAFLANGLACSSVCRLSFGSDIHSRMIFRRASCSGFMFKSYGSNLGRRCRCLKLIVPVAYGPAFRRLGTIKLLTCRIYSAPIASSLSLISGFSCKTMFNKELWTSRVPLYSTKPNLRNLFTKKHYDRLRWRPISGESGIRSNGWVHQPIKNEEANSGSAEVRFRG